MPATPLFPAEDLPERTEPSAIVNDNARRLEVAILPALSFEATEPGAPVEGGLYVLSAAWGDGAEDDLAYYLDSAWTFWTPPEGMVKEIAGTAYRVESGAWEVYAANAFAPIGVKFVADLDSTADSDPGAGLLKWNNATQASATELYVDDASDDGASLTGLWPLLGDGGLAYLQHQTDPDIWQIFEITSATDATGYVKLAGSVAAKSTADFADGDPMFVTFDRAPATSGLPDGDYGDITVSGSGTVMNIDAGAVGTTELADGAVTLAKQANMATASVVYRKTGGSGAPEVQTLATLKTDLGLTGTNSGDQDLTPYDTRGKQAVYVPAAAMRPAAASGCAALAQVATAGGQPDIVSLDFDPSSQEYAQFHIVPPKKWNGSTVTFIAHWSHAATTTDFGVAWGLQSLAVSNDDTIAASWGTGVVVTDTGGTTNDLYQTSESGAVTPAGSPAKLDALFFRAYRHVANAGDTMAIDARLMGLTVFFTTDASTDA